MITARIMARSKFAGITRGPATVDCQNVPIHVTVVRIRQKKGGHGDLASFGGTAEWDVREHLLHRVVEDAPFAIEELTRPVGQGRSGCDAIDQDTIRSELEGHCLGEVDDARPSPPRTRTGAAMGPTQRLKRC